MKKRYLLLCAVWLAALPFLSQAQTLKAYEKAGDQAMQKHEYYAAMEYYESVLKSGETSGILYKYADACRLSLNYQKAEEAYFKVLRGRDAKLYPLLGFHYATVLKHNGRYELAAQEFNRFAEGYASRDDYYAKKAIQEVKSCQAAKELVKNTADTVQVERLGDHINTPYSDFGAHYVDSILYYSSLSFNMKPDKDTKKAIEDARKRFIAKLLSIDDVKNGKSKELPGLNEEAEHTANSALSPDGRRLYFTRCNGDRSDSIVCAIYVSYRQEDGSWGRERRLPDIINLPGTNNTHPNVGWDSLKNRELLFFASNRPGGQGDLDIWYCSIQKDSIYGDVINIGTPINTIDAEATPFFHTPTQTLYFSSMWHEGLGGYDIFKVRRQNMVWQHPVNLGLPFNSAANDLYFIYNRNDTSGLFASNRTGSKAITGESCCNDIYAFSIQTKVKTPPVDTPLITKIDTPVTRIDTPLITKVDTPSTRTDTSSLANRTGGGNSGGGSGTNTNTGTNTGSGSGTNTGKTQPGTPSESEIALKIEELNKMLPLRLYFHNDEPDSNTTSTKTNTPYELPYQHYISLQETYMQEYARQYKVEKQPIMMDRVRDFFENEVKGEYNRMNQFFDKLLELLESGIKLDIYVKGYTSPRASEGYNKALAQRRITSVRKQLFIYKDGIFLQHFQSGKFWVHEVPLGEETAPSGISDDFDDPANSIYSVDASRERRAEISVVRRK